MRITIHKNVVKALTEKTQNFKNQNQISQPGFLTHTLLPHTHVGMRKEENKSGKGIKFDSVTMFSYCLARS